VAVNDAEYYALHAATASDETGRETALS